MNRTNIQLKKICIATLPMYALNFEILKFSAAPETHFLMFGGANSTFVGKITLLLSPSIEDCIVCQSILVPRPSLHTVF